MRDVNYLAGRGRLDWPDRIDVEWTEVSVLLNTIPDNKLLQLGHKVFFQQHNLSLEHFLALLLLGQPCVHSLAVFEEVGLQVVFLVEGHSVICDLFRVRDRDFEVTSHVWVVITAHNKRTHVSTLGIVVHLHELEQFSV